MYNRMVILSNDYPAENHPENVFVQQLAETLIDKGVDISVIAPQSIVRAVLRHIGLFPSKTTFTTAAGKTYHVFRPYSLTFGNGNKYLYKLVNKFNERRVNTVLESIKPTLLYGHFWHVAYDLKQYAKIHHIPLFVASGESSIVFGTKDYFIAQNEIKKFSSLVNGVISVSTDNKNKCIDLGLCNEEKIIVLPNGVDSNLFRPLEVSAFKRKLGISERDFVIAFTGIFVKRKGSKVVSDALKRIGDSSIKAIFIGQPLDGDDCTPDYEGIVFRGILSHEEIPYYLNCADVFVLPTLREGCCNSIVEALSCGIPVISSHLPFNDDILNDHNSLRIDPENVDEVATAIIKMKKDKVFYSKIKEYTVAHSDNYSIASRADKIITFIKGNCELS